MKTFLSFLLSIIGLAAVAQPVPPVLRNPFTTNLSPAALNIVTQILNSYSSPTGGVSATVVTNIIGSFKTHLQVEDFGAVAGQANFETNLMAAVKTTSLAGGGLVTLERPGLYLLYNQGTNQFATAFRKSALFTNIVNVELRIGAGVEIRLANGQQRNSGTGGLLTLSNGPVDLFYTYRCTNFTISGAFILNGNTEGQTAWTNASPRDNYTQVTSGNLIRALQCENVSVIGSGGFITLTNCFSNPINFQVNNYGQARNIRVYSVGEGIQFISSKGNVFQNLWTFDLANTMVGDCYESATCTNTYASEIYAFHSGTNEPANFWDAGGSSGFTLDGFYGEWPIGVGFGVDGVGNYPKIVNFKVANGTLIGENRAGAFGFDPTEGYGVLHNVKFFNFQSGFYSDTTNRTAVIISDCTFENSLVGIGIYGLATLAVNNNTFISNYYAMLYNETGLYDHTGGTAGPTTHLIGNRFLTNNTALYFSGDGANLYTIRGEYSGNYFLGNVLNRDTVGAATILFTNTVWTNIFPAIPNLNALPGYTNTSGKIQLGSTVVTHDGNVGLRKYYVMDGGEYYAIAGLGVPSIGGLQLFAGESLPIRLDILDSVSNVVHRLEFHPDGTLSNANWHITKTGKIDLGGAAITNKLIIYNFGDGTNNMLIEPDYLARDLWFLNGAFNGAGRLRFGTIGGGSNRISNLDISAAGIITDRNGNRVVTNSTGIDGGSGSVSDTAFASSWNGVTTDAPSKNAVYDWAHIFDTDDDGKVNVLDIGAGIPKTDSGGVVSAISDGTGVLTNNGSGTVGWMAIPSGGSGTPGGNSGAVQFNQGGVLDGSNTFNLDRTNSILSLRNGAATGSEYFYLGGSLSVPNWSMASDTNWFRLQNDFGTAGVLLESKKTGKFINIGSTANNVGTNFGDWYFPSNVTAGSLTASGAGNGAITLIDTANSKSFATTVSNVTQNISNIFVDPWPTGPGWCWQVASSNLNATTTFYDVRWTNGPCGSGGGVPGTNVNQFAASTTLAIKKEALLTNVVLIATNGVAAAADQAGEVIETTNYINVALSTGTTATLLTNILTPGRWLVTTTVYVNRNGATFSGAGLQASLVDTLATDGVIPRNSIEEAQTTTFLSEALDVINYPQFTTTNRPIYTTLYPGSFSVGTPQAKAVTRAIRQP